MLKYRFASIPVLILLKASNHKIQRVALNLLGQVFGTHVWRKECSEFVEGNAVERMLIILDNLQLTSLIYRFAKPVTLSALRLSPGLGQHVRLLLKRMLTRSSDRG